MKPRARQVADGGCKGFAAPTRPAKRARREHGQRALKLAERESFSRHQINRIKTVRRSSQISEPGVQFGNLHLSITVGFATHLVVILAAAFDLEFTFGHAPILTMFHRLTGCWR